MREQMNEEHGEIREELRLLAVEGRQTRQELRDLKKTVESVVRSMSRSRNGGNGRG